MAPKVLLIRPADATLEIDRTTTAMTGSLRADLVMLRSDHPMTLLRHARGLRNTIRAADVVHAFGSAALICALAAGGGRIVHSPDRWPTQHRAAWLRAAMAYRSFDIVCSGDALRRTLIARGIPADRTHLIRPGIAVDSVSSTRDEGLRARLGIAPDDRIVYAPGEITAESGHAMAMWGVSIAAVIEPRYRLLVRGARPFPADVGKRILNPTALIDAAALAPDVPTEQLFGVADAVIFTPTGPISPLLIATAMASGRPILASPTPQIRELLEDRRNALLINGPSPRVVAQRIEDLFSDSELTSRLAESARADACVMLTQSEMINSLRNLYDGIASGATKTA